MGDSRVRFPMGSVSLDAFSLITVVLLPLELHWALVLFSKRGRGGVSSSRP